MVLTVTLNPLLERRFEYPFVNFEKVNRNGKLLQKAGGKGINVSRQLKKLGIKTTALLFSGGNNGKVFRDLLRSEEIPFSEIHTKAETRTSAIIIECNTKKLFTFFGDNAEISESECNQFLTKMEKMISNCGIVVFAGSSPCRITDNLFSEGINIANKLDKISICDTYGNNLNLSIESSPTILHTNLEEAESALNIDLQTEKQKLEYLNYLYSKGIKQAYLTDGANNIYASNFDFHYSASVPKIISVDATGSGDAFVAGISYGMHNNYVFEDQLKLAASLGVNNAKTFETCEVKLKEAEDTLDEIRLNKIGKKIKVINDNPG